MPPTLQAAAISQAQKMVLNKVRKKNNLENFESMKKK
jgi:hypothetical protein